ncbi:DUF3601 domain-containing protein [Aeromonas cavernicola]|uniref:Uncharacterized protein n=1 Tax=Aeromonas cavernicola TaxID=1006623 RepID=A0A2H9U4K3_9GAMM|nr:DUF3601 domain-containing protein [Aeromonas cavernicola]PJG58909.1 hypothetical protein CUC53_10145 [Aeromonas cavernicola]
MYLREAIEKALSLLNKDSSNKKKLLSSYFSYESNTGGINCPDRNILFFKSTREGVDGEITISMRGMDKERDITLSKVITTENELISLVKEWQKVIYWWQSRLSFYRLESSAEYNITRDFSDLDGRNLKNGTTFSLLAKDLFAKEEGYTLKTSIGTIRLHGQINRLIIENLDLYIDEAGSA